MSNKQSNKQ